MDMEDFVKVDKVRMEPRESSRKRIGGQRALIGVTVAKKGDCLLIGSNFYDSRSEERHMKTANLYYDGKTKRFAIELFTNDSGNFKVTSNNPKGTSARIGCSSFIKQLNLERGFYSAKSIENNKVICDYSQKPTVRRR